MTLCNLQALTHWLYRSNLTFKTIIIQIFFRIIYQLSLSKVTACLGKYIIFCIALFMLFKVSVSFICCSCPAFSSTAICSAVGLCGEPIFFQASYELLCVSSILYCVTFTFSAGILLIDK